MSELKPCPRCKSDKVNWDVVFLADSGEPLHFVRCSRCRYEGPMKHTERKAIAAWNALDRTDYRALAVRLAEALKKVQTEGFCPDCANLEDGTDRGGKCTEECAAMHQVALTALDAAKKAGVIV